MATYLTRTVSDATSNRLATFSFWVKRSNISDADGQGSNYLFCLAGPGGFSDSDWLGLQFRSVDTLRLTSWYGGINVTTNKVFRDPASWYHIVVRIDTTAGAAANRVRIYINGTEQTSFGNSSYPSQDYDFNCLGDSGAKHYVGCAVSGSVGSPSPYDYTNGYIADFNFTSGQSYPASSFGETDSTTGEWKPKSDLSGLTYGDNGFRLKFENAGSLGADTSGQGHNLTVSGAGTNAQTTDTPSNNFAVLNTIAPDGGTFTLGGLKYVTNGTDLVCGISSFALTGSSKWYCEMKAITKTGNYFNFGVASSSKSMNDNGIIYRSDGKIYKDGSENQSSLATFTDNDIIGVIYDCSNNQCSFQKNGSAVGSAVTIGDATRDIFFITGGNGGTNSTSEINFGNPPFSISSTNADSAGLGVFEYAVPSGAYSLCTKNLNTYG